MGMYSRESKNQHREGQDYRQKVQSLLHKLLNINKERKKRGEGTAMKLWPVKLKEKVFSGSQRTGL